MGIQLSCGSLVVDFTSHGGSPNHRYPCLKMSIEIHHMLPAGRRPVLAESFGRPTGPARFLAPLSGEISALSLLDWTNWTDLTSSLDCLPSWPLPMREEMKDFISLSFLSFFSLLFFSSLITEATWALNLFLIDPTDLPPPSLLKLPLYYSCGCSLRCSLNSSFWSLESLLYSLVLYYL